MNSSGIRVSLLLFIGFFLGVALMPVSGWSKTYYHWVQLVEGKPVAGRWLPGVSVRAIVEAEDACPILYATAEMKKGDPLFTLTERAKQGSVAKGKGFAEIKVCEHQMQPDDPLLQRFTTGYLKRDKKAVPVVLPDLSQGGMPLGQLITSGCTGCRDEKAQYCSEKAAKSEKKGDTALPWLFGELNAHASRGAGDGIPPLWVHLGDMRYSGQKNGVADSWKKSEDKLGWREEFFEPTAPFMEKGFSIILRGNHEGCFIPGSPWNHSDWQDRGEAWFYFFGQGNQQCSSLIQTNDMAPPFAMDAVVYGGGVSKPVPTQKQVRMIFLDTVRTGDNRDSDPKKSEALYKEQFDLVAKKWVSGEKPAWLFQHIPVYELNKKGKLEEDGTMIQALQRAQWQSGLSHVAMVASAHLHQLNVIRADQQPTQVTVGNGGVALSGRPGSQCRAEGKSGLFGLQSSRFGYLNVRFALRGEQVEATYELPLFKPVWGPLQEEQRITCTGQGDQLFRPVCPTKDWEVCS